MNTKRETDKQAEHALIAEEISTLLKDANRLIESTDVSFAEARRIAGGISEIRQLLNEWSNLERRLVPARPIAEEVRILRDRSLELEGLVKEVRNGLEREQRRSRLEAERR